MPTLKQLLFFSSLSSTVFAQQKCNGWSEFCSKSLKEIALPFSHNAYAYPNASAASIPPTANQDRGWTLDQQLKDGIRAMELDLLFRNQSSGSPQLWLCHDTCDGIIGFAGPSLSSAAASISTFLSAVSLSINRRTQMRCWYFCLKMLQKQRWPTLHLFF